MLVGTVAKKDLLDKRNIQPGDSIIMTKAAGIEGTAIIARECAKLLRGTGMPETEIAECGQYLDQISVLEEARIAARSGAVSAMHDVTEGGIVTALEELGAAGGCKIRVAMEKIKVYPLTERLCSLLAINPLGLIGSGCLLICCKAEASDNLCAALTSAGIDNAVIGEVLDRGEGIDAFYNGTPAAWPHFVVDELARFFQGKT
jgi:hydrogenase maturation factor